MNEVRENYLALLALECLEDENFEVFKKILLKHKINPNYVVLERGIAPIHFACGMDNLEMAEIAVEFILDNNGNPNTPSTEQMTPLHIAAMFGRKKIVRMLLEKGADLNLQDSSKLTPLQYAIYEVHFDVIEVVKKFVFEKKKEENRKHVEKHSQDQDDNYLQVKKSHVSHLLQNLENDKSSPKKMEYNYDATSPFYINITHRRLKLRFPDETPNMPNDSTAVDETVNENLAHKENSKPPNFLTSTLKDNYTERRNLFELTEQNLEEINQKSVPEKSRLSLIKSWRDNVHKTKRSILHKFKDIDSLLNIVIENDNVNFNNSILTDSTSSGPKFFNNTGFGKLLTKLKNVNKAPVNQSFQTALDTSVESVENLVTADESNFIHSPNGNEFVLQMAEQYLHTDTEHGLMFVEERLLMNPPLRTNDSDNKKVVDINQSQLNISSETTTLPDYDTEHLKAELTQFGDPPGPITKTTKRLYTKRLLKHRKDPDRVQSAVASAQNKPNFSHELERTVRNIEQFQRIPEFFELEPKMYEMFKHKAANTKWRDGNLKQSFIYLLIDPRISDNLPLKSKFTDQHTTWKQFLNSIFYVGKGKSARPFAHLYNALKFHTRMRKEKLLVEGQFFNIDDNQNNMKQMKKKSQFIPMKLFEAPQKNQSESKKIERILDIWKDECGVVCLHTFHNILSVEAFTREASIIDAIGLQRLTNLKRGEYYGVTKDWTRRDQKQLGVTLLLKAMQIYLAEGESQIFPSDLVQCNQFSQLSP